MSMSIVAASHLNKSSMEFEEALLKNFQESKKSQILRKRIETQTKLPTSIKNTSNFDLESSEKPVFEHIHESPNTVIALNLNEKVSDLPDYLKKEKEVYSQICSSFNDFAFNEEYFIFLTFAYLFRYRKKFLLIQSFKSIENQKDLKYYCDFIISLFDKIHQKIYGKNIIFDGFFSQRKFSFQSIGAYLSNENSLLKFDFLNDSIIKTAFCLKKIINKITDDKITNCFVLSYHTFLHPINQLLSPAALSLSFFNHHLLSLKNNLQKQIYTPQSLPRVVYLNLSGIYSEIDIDVINEFSSNVQTISIYDERTGGPQILSRTNYDGENDMRKASKNFQKISDKLLLIPLKCPERKCYGQNDILNIMEEIVVKSIAQFKPSYIVLNCSLIFDEASNNPFLMDEKTLSQIIHLLNQVSDCRILIYPFKLPNMDLNENKRLFKESMAFIDKPNQQERFSYIFEKYAQVYNEEFVRDSFINMIENLANLKDVNSCERTAMKKKSGANPLMAEMIFLLTKHYKNHPYYNFLYSKAYKSLIRISKAEAGALSAQKGASISNNVKKSNKIILLNEDKFIKSLKLKVQSNEADEVLLDKNSQYLIDYQNPKEPLIYIFNARLCKDYFMTRTYGEQTHLVLKYDLEPSSSLAEISFQYSLNDKEKTLLLKDFGLCRYESFVFQIYGTEIESSKDTNKIICFNFENGENYQIKIKQKNSEILARHSVTSCAFKKKGKYYLYIFGGQVQDNITYNDKNLTKLNIIDFVEIYSTDNLSKDEWDYKLIPINQLLNDKEVRFIPYKNSYAHYDENTENIIIMGGSGPKNSSHGWIFPVFKFDVNKGKFISFEVFLNEMKGFSKRKYIQGDEAKHVIPVAIADNNKNFSHNEKEKTFKFLVPFEDEENLICVYSYNYETNQCDFDQILFPEEETSVPTRPPNLNVGEKDIIIIPAKMSKELYYIIKKLSFCQRMYLFKLIQGMISLDRDMISIQEFDSYLKKTRDILNSESLSQEKTEGSSSEESELNEKIGLIDFIENYIKNENNKDILLNKRGLLQLIKFIASVVSNLQSSISKEPLLKIDDDDRVSQMSFSIVDSELSEYDTIQMDSKSSKTLKSRSIIFENPILVLDKDKEKEEYKTTAGRTGKDLEEKKDDDSYIIIQKPLARPKEKINSSQFTDCVAKGYGFRVLFNYAYNGITVISPQNNQGFSSRDFRFKVFVDDELEDISFYLNPSSITVYRGAIICYIDQEFKKTHPEIYKKYKNWILHASIPDSFGILPSGKLSKNIILCKLFNVAGDESIFNRNILVNEESLFLIGGKSIKFKGKKNRNTYYRSLARYKLKLLKGEVQNSNEFKDTEMDDMEENEGISVAIQNENFIFMCQKESPNSLEIFDKDGAFEETVQLPVPRDWSVHLNLVQFQEKEQILIIAYALDHDMKFWLYDIKGKSLDENVKLVFSKDGERKKEMNYPILYSGNEVFEENVDTRPLENILIYNYREEQPKIIKYEIVTDYEILALDIHPQD